MALVHGILVFFFLLLFYFRSSQTKFASKNFDIQNLKTTYAFVDS